MTGISAISGEALGGLMGGIATRLADEGVPIAAIARALKYSAEEVRRVVHTALSAGQLVFSPREDWPSASSRETRRPLWPATGIDDDQVVVNAIRIFKITKSQARLLGVLLKRSEASKKMLLNAVTEPQKDEPELKIVDVYVCKMRKRLKDHGLDLVTIWGYGYSMSLEHRKRAYELLGMDFSTAVETVALAA